MRQSVLRAPGRRRRRSGTFLTGALAASTLTFTSVATDGGAAHAAEFVVTNVDPTGAGSLFQAITDANANGNSVPDVITFDLPDGVTGPIVGDLPAITTDVRIAGPGRDQLTITPVTQAAISVSTGADLTIVDLTVGYVAPPMTPFPAILATGAGDLVLERVGILNASDGVSVASPGSPLTIDDLDVDAVTGDGSDVTGASTVTVGDVRMTGVGGVGLDVDDVATLTVDDMGVMDATGHAIEATAVTTVRITGSDVGGTLGATGIHLTGAGTALGSAALDDVTIGAAATGALTVMGFGDVDLLDVAVTDSQQPSTIGNVTDVVMTDVDWIGGPSTGLVVDAIGSVSVEGSSFRSHGLDGLQVVGNGTAALTVDDTEFAANRRGLVLDRTDATITDSIFSANASADALRGALSIGGIDQTVTVRSSRFNDNTTGAIVAADTFDLTIDQTDFVSNSGTSIVEMAAPPMSGSEATIRNTTFRNNTVQNGTFDTSIVTVDRVDLDIVNSTFTANSASSAMVGNIQGSAVTVGYSTFVGNTVTTGPRGVLHLPSTGSFTATHSIFSANSGGTPSGPTAISPPQPGSISNSLLRTGEAASYPTGSNVFADDPKLGPLDDNGGATLTLLPAVDSPAVDAGAATSTVATDQRGFIRPDGSRTDIGAVERQQSPFVVEVTPARLMDTRLNGETVDDQFEKLGQLADGTTTILDVAGRATVPLDAVAAVVNITAVNPTGRGFITAHPCKLNQPLASSLNFDRGSNSGNEIVVELDANGDVCLFNRTPTDLTVDVVGFVPSTSRYAPVEPARLLDTRSRFGATIDGQFEKGGRRPDGAQLTLDVAGRGGVSADAQAVVVNLTAINPSDRGYVTAHPCLANRPTTASLNYDAGIVRGNEIVIELDANGDVCLFNRSETDLIIDVVGEIDSEVRYEAVGPARLVDTRSFGATVDGQQAQQGPLAAGQTYIVRAAGRAGIPATAQSVVVNATAIRPAAKGFITVYDCVGAAPNASSLNYDLGDIKGNELVVGLNTSGEFCVFASESIELTIDVVGYARAPVPRDTVRES